MNTSAFMHRNMPHYEPIHDLEYLRKQIARCRRLAREMSDTPTGRTLTELAGEYEARLAAMIHRPEETAPHPAP
jgi:hypothetical protein